jgi:hypothetical protein
MVFKAILRALFLLFMDNKSKEIIEFLNEHRNQFLAMKNYANETGHPVPSDTKFFSQILISLLSNVRGIDRKKGPDLSDGSDVKAALVWDAIDTPRFNGCIKAGTKSGLSDSMKSLDAMPHLYLVMWDEEPARTLPRCRVWVVRPQHDVEFRAMCKKWYGQKTSNNFQLHPPRNKNSNIIRNTCGNLEYPLYFEAIWQNYLNSYQIITHDETVLTSGQCVQA